MKRARLRRRLAVLWIGPVTAACATSPVGHETLDATLWIQTSVEYRAVAQQAYVAAARGLDEALADSGWTAALEQTGEYEALPPAIILDVDETVLDNSPESARRIRSGAVFDTSSWYPWVREARAAPVPGASAFLAAAHEKGVTVYYVTNRDAVNEEATRRNLAQAGLPLEEDLDTILTRGERPEWRTDKGSRRAFVARDHRILLLVGDNLEDFVSGARASLAEREALRLRYSGYWGRRWIVLPNPMYGSWADALTGFRRGLSAREALETRAGYLETAE